MLDQLQKLHAQTQEMMAKLSEIPFEEWEDLANKRERIFAELIECQEQYSEDEKKKLRHLVNEIIKYDPKIKGRMQQLMLEASEGIQHIQALKKQQKAYISQGPADSLFFDTKK